MAPHLVTAQSAYKDIRIHSFRPTRKCVRAHTHTLSLSFTSTHTHTQTTHTTNTRITGHQLDIFLVQRVPCLTVR